MNVTSDSRRRLAAGLWSAAAALYLGAEAAAASVFWPDYSYATNYISDLGTPVCGMIFAGRMICSPLHLLVNADFALQGLMFMSAAVVMASTLSGPAAWLFVTFAVLNGIGNSLVGLFPAIVAGQVADPTNYHTIGALLSVVFGNATAFVSAWAFRELGLARIHRLASLALPFIGLLAFAILAKSGSGPTVLKVFPRGVWERIGVYAIPAWALMSAFCVMAVSRGREASVGRAREIEQLDAVVP